MHEAADFQKNRLFQTQFSVILNSVNRFFGRIWTVLFEKQKNSIKFGARSPINNGNYWLPKAVFKKFENCAARGQYWLCNRSQNCAHSLLKPKGHMFSMF